MSYDPNVPKLTFVVLSPDNADTAISNERFIQVAGGLTIQDNGPGSSVVISASGVSGGSGSDTVSSKSADFTAAAGNLYNTDISANNVVATLPTAASISGQTIKIRITVVGGAPPWLLTVNTTSSQTVNGFVSGWQPPSRLYDVYVFESDGSNWMLV